MTKEIKTNNRLTNPVLRKDDAVSRIDGDARETDSGVSDEKTKTLSVKTESRPATDISSQKIKKLQLFMRINEDEKVCVGLTFGEIRLLLKEARAEKIKEVMGRFDKWKASGKTCTPCHDCKEEFKKELEAMQ